MFKDHYPLFLVIVLGVGLACFMLALSSALGPRRPSRVKSEPFECGNLTSAPVMDRFNVKFYLVGILFLVFDIEAVFVYPWAVVFFDATHAHDGATPALSPLFVVLEMVTFVAIVLVGLTYAWRKGALEWGHEDALQTLPEAARHTHP